MTIAIRPEPIRLVEIGHDRATSTTACVNEIDVTVTKESFLGDHYEYGVTTGVIDPIAQDQNHASTVPLTTIIEPGSSAVVAEGRWSRQIVG